MAIKVAAVVSAVLVGDNAVIVQNFAWSQL